MMSHHHEIVDAEASHAGAITSMTIAAFAQVFGTGGEEAALIGALRAAGDVVVELVALERDELVGHILFSRAIDEPFTGAIAALAPMCARIDRQRAGIGSLLVRKGLERCRAQGLRAVVVLGDTDYYGRFGFSADLAKDIECAYAGPHFQALELEPGALKSVKRVRYAPAFTALDSPA